MRKLTMALDALEVETFDTEGMTEGTEGTVLGRMAMTGWCTLDDFHPCNLPTNSPLDIRCQETTAPVPAEGQGGNCTNACWSGALVCDTSVEACG